MRFEKIIPTGRLRPFIKHLVIAENSEQTVYKVLPSTNLVLGFQYRGKLIHIGKEIGDELATAGITGLSDSYKVFQNSANIGTILVYFTETGISHFSDNPAHELFNQSIGLHHLFHKDKIAGTEEKLSLAGSDSERIKIVERFLLSEVREREVDKLVLEAVKIIYASKGSMRIRELSEKLLISKSPLEKRFRHLVGTSPKKFASIVRFNAVLSDLNGTKSLTDLCYEYNFFDQAHFIKDFKRFTGDTPEQFKRLL